MSNEYTVPLYRGHHRQLHQAGNKVSWWEDIDINALEIAKGLWEESLGRSTSIVDNAKIDQTNDDRSISDVGDKSMLAKS